MTDLDKIIAEARNYMIGIKVDVLYRYKARIDKMNLLAEDYEIAIRKLADAIGI